MKKILFCLILSSCSQTIKVSTHLDKMPIVDIQTEFEDVKLKPVEFVNCEDNKLCLSKENAINLYDNIKALKEHINYIKSSYTCDIKAYKSIVNNEK